MSKVVIDKKRINALVDRGVERILPGRSQLLKKLASGDKLKLYCGFDPTAESLHIGNAITLNKLGQFQDLGHEVIFLIGNFTGLIGDPTDKKAARRQLSQKEVEFNARNYQKQASAYLKFDGDNPAKVLYNGDWNSKLSFSDLIKLASNFTVQQMIQRDMFQLRLKEEKAIYLHEFLYPLVQAYDSVYMGVDLEVGGNDQMFNMMCGRDLLKSLKNKEKFVMTMKLLVDSSGQKMGKSENNAVFLNTDPEDMYGKLMSWPDEVIVSAFELCTRVPELEIKEIASSLKAGDNPRDHKARLAWEITKMNHGAQAANLAQDRFINTFQKKEVPDDLSVWRAQRDSYLLTDLLFESGLAVSKTEARRLVQEGAIKIKQAGDFVTATDPQQSFSIRMDMVISRGKRRFIKITRS